MTLDQWKLDPKLRTRFKTVPGFWITELERQEKQFQCTLMNEAGELLYLKATPRRHILQEPVPTPPPPEEALLAGDCGEGMVYELRFPADPEELPGVKYGWFRMECLGMENTGSAYKASFRSLTGGRWGVYLDHPVRYVGAQEVANA